MDIYKYESRKKKRGSHCLCISADSTYGCLCGCGARSTVDKNYKKRMIRRALKKNLLKEQFQDQ